MTLFTVQMLRYIKQNTLAGTVSVSLEGVTGSVTVQYPWQIGGRICFNLKSGDYLSWDFLGFDIYPQCRHVKG
jgi:hypothetical protein